MTVVVVVGGYDGCDGCDDGCDDGVVLVPRLYFALREEKKLSKERGNWWLYIYISRRGRS